MRFTRPVFIHSTCASFTKSKENIKKSGDFRYIYQSKLDKAFYST